MAMTPEHSADLEQLKRALVAVRKLRARVDELEQAGREPLAIVGIGCRLPGGATSPQLFWRLLHEGQNAVVEVPRERWDAEAYWAADANTPGKVPTRHGGFLAAVDRFDPHFFGIAPREAAAMDPQQRLVLETAWEALEDAGIPPDKLAGSLTGVFIGIGLNDYGRLQVPAQAADPTLNDTYSISGNGLCIAANRLSYLLDLQGPSMAIDTACSSSLVALHQACRSLRNGDCTLALVGGSNVMLAPELSISVSKFLAADGRCKFGDARADGYVRGEGVLMVVLMKLSRALAEGAPIYALVRGSAINQDGYSSGLTVPNGVAQQALLRAALADAGVAPQTVSYVEAHGTGTALGDPIELQALGAVLGAGRGAGEELLVGSVKTNLGHLEAGAGLAGLVKVALALRHGAIPPSLHFTRPNPHIPFEQLRLRVPTALTPWPRSEVRRIAGVSSFGFGGANAHVILEEAPAAPEPAALTTGRPLQILALSAKDAPALRELAARYVALLAEQPDVPLADLCATASCGRSHFAHRAAFTAATAAELRDQLEAFANGDLPQGASAGVAGATAPRVAFLFTGQGAQYAGMGHQLYATQPIFRAAFDRCAELLRPQLGRDLRELSFGEDATDHALLDQTTYTQPALFALEYALAELWQSWGVTPTAVLGHSVGEYVAAVVAGVMSLEDGLRLVAARGRLMGGLPAGGAMAAIFATPERVRVALAPHAGRVAIAALNEPEHVVISGEVARVEAVRAAFAAEGLKTRHLATSHAFHSPLMDPILAEFEQLAQTVTYRAPTIALISNLSGEPWAPGQAPDATYWRRHLREPVQFAAGVQALGLMGCQLFLELGPAPVLAAAGSRCLPQTTFVWAPSLRQSADDWQTMLKSLGALYVAGAEVDWRSFEGDYPRRHVAAPTYPFQRERYWFKAGPPRRAAARTDGQLHPLLDRRLRSPALKSAVFESELSLARLPVLADHRVYGTAVFPAAGYVELVLAAARHAFGQRAQLGELLVHQALAVPDEGVRTLQVVLVGESAAAASFEVLSHDTVGEAWRTHASGRLTPAPAAPATPEPSLAAAQASCRDALDIATMYEAVGAAGMGYGPAFRGLAQLWRGEGAALGQVRLADHLEAEAAAYALHPALLDACLQVAAALLPPDSEALYLPLSIEDFYLHGDGGTELWSHVALTKGRPGDETLGCRLRIFDPAGVLVAEARLVTLKLAPRAALQPGAQARSDWLYEVAWRPQPLAGPPSGAEPGHWLIVGAAGGHGEALAGHLSATGARSTLVIHGPALAQLAPGCWQADLASPAQLRQAVEAAHADEPLRGAVFLGLELAADSPPDEQRLSFGGALHLVQALATGGPARLFLVTSGAHAVGGSAVINPGQATLWGLGRVVAREQPELGCACVDLDPTELASSLGRLAAELLHSDDEAELALRGGERFVARLVPRQRAANAHDAPVQLAIRQRGTFEGLLLRPTGRPQPGPGEVLIEVRAAGLNFRDVLNVLGMYPGEAGGLGHECAGTVAAVGVGVPELRVGDRVLAIAGDSLGTFALAQAALSLPIPAALSFAEAATVPIAFTTAAYGLRTLAGLAPGERVLVHAAAGGVGLAAVQLAQLTGAEVIGTAGSPEKRAFLNALGVEHVFDSRSLSFTDDVMRVTGGAGVDVVLNSLSGELIPASLAVLRDGGRFLEIGKRGIWDEAQVAALGRHIDYHVIYLGAVCERDPALVGAILSQLVAELASGALRPLPLRLFPLAQAADAFRYMAQARHIGKVVLEPAAGRPLVRPDGTYLITGGLGGVGLATARWLAEAGARHLALLGRRAPSPEAEAAIAAIAATGVQVRVAQADVSRPEELAQVLARLDAEQPPLRGVVHAAGILDDGPLAEQTWERSAAVLAPKVAGAWALHQLTASRDLDWFALFSAGSALLGAPGQGSYAAGNAFLDSLAHARRAAGLPALSLNWGVWGEVGMAAALGTRERQRLADQGFQPIAPADGLRALAAALGQDAAQLAVLPVDWSRFAHQLNGRPLPSLLRELARPTPRQGAAHAPDLPTRLAQTAPGNRRALLRGAVREHAGRVLGLAQARPVDPRQPLSELGLDSLMAVELRNSLGVALDRPLPATLLFDYPTIEGLAGFLEALLAPPEPQPAADVTVRHTALMADLEQLSDAEAEALLLAELNALTEGR